MNQNLSEVFNAHRETTDPTRNIRENPPPVERLRLLHQYVDNTGQGRDDQIQQANAPGYNNVPGNPPAG